MTSRRFVPFSVGVCVYSLLVILWGYFLRISGSGDGCGTDWPLCHGAVLPDAPHFATVVEFTHRLSSGVVLILVVAMAVWAVRAFPRRSAVRAGAAAALVLTLTESAFGAMLVVYGWVAGDVSTARILIRPVHVTNTFLLLAALVLTAWWAARGVGKVPSLGGPRARALLPAFGGVLLLAATGAWTGLAATAFPAGTVRDGIGQYVEPEHLLIYLRVSHPVLALAVVALLLLLARKVTREWAAPGSAAWRLAGALALLAGLQMLAGPLTVLLGNPVWARLAHLLLADLLWVTLVLLGAAVLEPGLPRARPAADSGRQVPVTPR